MKTVDLSSYNLDDLAKLQQDIETEIKARQRRDLRSAREKILAIAQEAGVSIEELLATATQKPKGVEGQKVKPQFRNPLDESQTWAGRARQPRWIAEGIAQGKTLDDFRI